MTIYFSENIKELRTKRGLTQEKLADFLGVAFQTVSKWERGECYPDIELLPDIAGFFNVSVDELLGVNRAENEQRLEKLLEEYDHYLNDFEKQSELIERLVKEFPNDFRVKLRYMVTLFGKRDKKSFDKINQIYDNIISYCTNDSIRIAAKKYIAQYYHTISHFNPELGITNDDVEKILDEMPSMRDGKEYLRSYLNPQDSEHCKQRSQEAVELELCLLYHGLYHLVFFSNRYGYPTEFLVEVCEKILDLTEFCFDDGNYGRMWRNILFLRYRLSELYFNIGEIEKAYTELEALAKAAKRFDEMDKITVMQSKMFCGREFDKDTLGSTFIASVNVKEKVMSENYNVSDEFKGSERFKAIINMLG